MPDNFSFVSPSQLFSFSQPVEPSHLFEFMVKSSFVLVCRSIFSVKLLKPEMFLQLFIIIINCLHPHLPLDVSLYLDPAQ